MNVTLRPRFIRSHLYRDWVFVGMVNVFLTAALAAQGVQSAEMRQVEVIETVQAATANELRAPASAQSAAGKARSAMIGGRTEEARKEVSRALAAYPNYAIALSIRSLLDLDAGKTREAMVDAQQAIQSDPDYGPPYVVLGALYNHFRQYDDALPMLARAAQLIPSAWQVNFQMGQALFGKRDDAGALAELTSAIGKFSHNEIPENRALVHFWRAHILVQLKDLPDARSEYQQVVVLGPDTQLAGFARKALTLLSATSSLAESSGQALTPLIAQKPN